MKLSHIFIASAAAVSFSAIAADEQKSQKQPQAQSGQQQSQSSSHSQETVKQVQQKLSDAGHQLEVDGIMGPKTQAALREYQQKNNLQASGQLDQKTMAALGVSEGGSASASSGAGGSASTGSSAGKSEESSSQGASGGMSQPEKKSQ